MENLHEVLRYWARRWPGRLAIRSGGRDITWGELDHSSDEIASGLHAAGVRKGDRVGVLMHNRIEFVQSMLGAWKIGAAVTLLNVRFMPREMVYPVVDAGLGVVITEPSLVGALELAAREVPHLQVFSADAAQGLRTLDDLRAQGTPLPAVDVQRDDIALVCYTSGTTGVPKGAMISHGNLWASSLARVVPSGINFDDKLLVSLPLAYTGGISNYIRDGLVPGATTVLESSFDAQVLMDVIEREKIATWTAVPVLLERIMQHRRFREVDFSALRNVCAGGAPVSKFLLRSWRDIGVPITQGYGLTEVSGGFATILFPEEAERKLGSAGRAVLHTGLRIMGVDGRPCAPGEVGEICVQGPTVMQGYLNKPDETQAIMDGRWMRTGDTGFLDEEGFMTVVDRSKDMLISGGLNVYPAELERALADVPGIGEFVVIGVPDASWGEVPMIVAHNCFDLDVEVLKTRLRQELADYKRPRFLVDYGQPLPRTYSGKVQKWQLREAFASVPAQAVWLKDGPRQD
jgi:fatty-acyl-CoA synthase